MLQLTIGLCDAPFAGSVQRTLGLALGRVQRLEWVAEIVAEDSGVVDPFFPALAREGLDRPFVPRLGGGRRAAPVTIPDMQHMIAEVFEDFVGRFRAGEIGLVK